MLPFLALVATVTVIIVFLHWYSYGYLKSSIIGRRRWSLNICCGATPAWDLAAALNIWEHRWIFLTVRKVHYRLPRRIELPLARRLQARIGQRVTAQ